MRILIIGLGSIAKKHIEAIRSLDLGAELFALRSNKQSEQIEDVSDIYSWNEVPEHLDFMMISNPTSEHYHTISTALTFKVPLFIEKPALASIDKAMQLVEELENNGVVNYVAFSLRFNPVIQWLKMNLDSKSILEMSAYCGSYLPNWRPKQDYRTNYSAHRNLGGGVHLDLIHELDYVTWILGKPITSTAFFSKVSTLEIDSYDSAHYWLAYKNKNASVTLNYYRKDAKRKINIVLDTGSWTADLLTNEVKDEKGKILFQATVPKNHIYEEQMKYFMECIKTKKAPMNSLKESMEVLEMALSKNNER